MGKLILVRHGNTFEADQTPTFVGGKTDLKLTNDGEAQGHAIAQMIAQNHQPISSITTGPLIRTRRFAEMIQETTGADYVIDDRLKEIDYGLWENKTTEEVITAYGAGCVESWERDGLWPEAMNWAPSLDVLEGNVRSLLSEMHEKLSTPNAQTHVIVTSNGILRFVYRQITGANPDKKAKVKTGAYCILTPATNGWEIDVWNERPAS